MGEKNRFRRFAEFIGHTFPYRNKVADVAGGHGELAYLLFDLGKEPTIIEPRDATFPRWIHREIRKRAVREDRFVKIERVRRLVEEANLRRFDLIVAMHPDQATEPAIRAAIEHDLDFAVVPCCPFPLEGRKSFGKEWIRHLASLSPGIRTTRLDFAGPSTCLWRNSAGATTEVQPVQSRREAVRVAVARLARIRFASDVER